MSFHAEPAQKKAQYFTIKEGTFRLPSDKNDPDAVRRDYVNPKTKAEGTAYEKSYKSVYGTITDVSFVENTLADGTVLRSLNIHLGEDDNGISQIVSVPVDSRYTADFLKRLPVIDLTAEVKLTPYDFESDGPRQVGISVAQKDENGEFTIKINNSFFTEVKEKDGQKVYTNLHGFPEATEEDASDWPFYFKKVNKFLVSYAKQNILPKFHQDGLEKVFPTKPAYPTVDISPDDVPF